MATEELKTLMESEINEIQNQINSLEETKIHLAETLAKKTECLALIENAMAQGN